MKYYRPDIQLGTILGPQEQTEEKLGGLPWGLPSTLWPFCSHCKHPQTLLAELHHHSHRLDLGKEGRVLFIFHCNNDPGMCDDWDQNSGSNSAFIIENTEEKNSQTYPPEKETPI